MKTILQEGLDYQLVFSYALKEFFWRPVSACHWVAMHISSCRIPCYYTACLATRLHLNELSYHIYHMSLHK